MRKVVYCALALLFVLAACGDDETKKTNTTNATNTTNTANATNTASGTLKDKLQGSWKLTKLLCGTTDMSDQFANATIVVTIAGDTFTIDNDENGCKETEVHGVTYDDAKTQITIGTPTTPRVCVPAACKESCGSTDGNPEVYHVAFANTTFVITSDDATQFPNESCDPSAQPGAATFTKQ